MAANLTRLLAVGFRPAGKWSLVNQALRLTLEPSVMCEKNVLYAFTVDGTLTYVGKTNQSLLKRMQGYRSPASSAEHGGSTNIKNNRNIINALSSGSVVDIYVLHSLPTQQHGEFHVNLSAGLEDSLIEALAPPWNGRSQFGDTSSDGHLMQESRGVGRIPVTQASAIPRSRKPMARPSTVEAEGQFVQSANSTFPSTESLFSFCRRKQAETLTTTVRKTPFRVEVVGSYLEITPGSSKASRRESKANITALLARLGKTMSFQMSDYQDISFNASYVLALVKAWQAE
jgi:hypothetical protein